MTRPMRTVLAACTAISMSVAACGGGTTPNGHVAPKISSTPPDTATVGVPFKYTVTANGMTPVTFAVESGPDGFSIHPTSGVVTWTPEAEGTVSIEIRASNLAGRDTQAFDVDVQGLSGPVFTTEPPTEATVAAQYAYDPDVVANGVVSWSAPVAPNGLTIDPDTGAVRWTPSSDQAGMHAVTVRATEIESGRFADQQFTVTVVDTGGPAFITSTPPSRIYAGELLRYPAAASGAPTIQWTLEQPSSGSPASGVQIVTNPPEGGSVMVEWDTASVGAGDYSIALKVDNGLGNPDVQEFVVTVDPRPPVPEIDLVTAPPPATIFVGAQYQYDVNLTPDSESAGVIWSLVGATVPPELPITIDPDSGEVTFTASVANGEREYGYTVRAENVLGEGDEATITLDALYPPASPMLSVAPSTTFTLEVGESFPGASASASGNPTPVLSIAGTLPSFVQFDPLTGLLSASVAQPAPEEADIGSYAFDIVATNSEGMDSQTIEIAVVAAPPNVESITPAAGRRQSDVPVVVRGAGFVSAATPVVRLELGAYSETLATTYVDEGTLTATVPVDLARPSGVYDVVVDQGSTNRLSKRFTVTRGDGTLLGGTVGVDITLSAAASPHVITSDLRVENGATLTAEPGAVLMIAGATNRRIDVGVNGPGAFLANGGEPGVGDQIVITRFQDVGGPTPTGHYRGLRFGANLVSASTLLQNVVIEFGGRVNADTNRGEVEVLSGSTPRISDSIIRESLNFGLYAQDGSGSDLIDWFHDNQLTANGSSPINIYSNDVSTLGANLLLDGNGQDRIYVRGSTVNRPSASWANYRVPFYLNDGLSVRGGSIMSIAPGTEMRFRTGRQLQVSTNAEPGTLVASGTPQAPIRMTADSGTWRGVQLDDRIQSGTVIRNVRIDAFDAGVSGGLRVDNPANPGDRIAIVERCLFQSAEPGASGVYLSNNAAISSFENNVMDVDGISVSAPMPAFQDVIGPSNTYEALLRVRPGVLDGKNAIWSKPTAADGSTRSIRPTGNLTVTNGSLTILSGNQIEMPLNGEIGISDAQLLVDGSPSEPVAFLPAPGVAYWNRILLRGAGGGGSSRISHAVLRSAGSNPTLGQSAGRAAIVVQANAGIPATPAVTHTMIVDSNGYGMTFSDSTHCQETCDDNTIVGSRFSALRMHANFVGRFGVGNLLTGNDTSGTLGHEGVWVVGDTVNVSATWPANDVPYLIQGDIELRQESPLDPVPVWTIEPGAELRFASDRRARVGEGNDGILDARGTSTAPIIFTSIDTATPVFWRGIEFSQGSDGSTLDRVLISYGGRSANTGNVNFQMGSVVTIGAATFTHSEDYAAVIYAGSAPMFTGPPTDRVYMFNGQASNPGAGDPLFDCVRDVAAGTCIRP